MNINKLNYEIWLIDWLDGNLNEIQLGELRMFLKENPDLNEEFEELSVIRLNPDQKSFPDKDLLKRTAASLSEAQFEYLSVAYLENDLSDDQKLELKDSIINIPGKKRSFELIQKMKLSALPFTFRHKNRLIRRTVYQNVIRLSFIGLSAAAVIALVIISSVSTPKSLSVKPENTSQAIPNDSVAGKPAVDVKIAPEKSVAVNKTIIRPSQKIDLTAVSQKLSSGDPGTESTRPVQIDSFVASVETPRIVINKISVPAPSELNDSKLANSLVAYNSVELNSDYDDGRSKLSRFIAKTFREKLLKDPKPKDSPLKAYELAEAGVSGLNKLLGWEMALDKRNDENGDLKSVYFSSKILKFNAPVKKSELVQ